MDREDSSIEQGAANTLLRSVCSVISPCQGEGDMSGIPPRDEWLSSFPALLGGERRRPRFVGAPSCRMKDCGGQPTGERCGYVLSDKLALATGVAAWGPAGAQAFCHRRARPPL